MEYCFRQPFSYYDVCSEASMPTTMPDLASENNRDEQGLIIENSRD